MRIGEQPLPLFSISLNNKRKNLLDSTNASRLETKGKQKELAPCFQCFLQCDKEPSPVISKSPVKNIENLLYLTYNKNIGMKGGKIV